jgi:UDP-N-acetylmuramate dehydrogenase
LVVQVALKGVSGLGATGSTVFINAEAGEDWDVFVSQCVERGLQGIECLSGIPGFVGGTPVQNVGAYGQEVSGSIVEVRALDRRSGKIATLANADCGFSYRASIFNTTERDRFIVLSVTYSLTQDGASLITYKDLKDIFGDRAPSLKETREAVLNIRRAKSMVIDDNDPNSQSAGSFFKNPVVTAGQFEHIRGVCAKLNIEGVPSFPVGNGLVKVPAAWLIERAGFYKGYSLGSAGLSANHTLALINRGNASASDMIALKKKIEDRVQEVFSILLAPEPVFVGF